MYFFPNHPLDVFVILSVLQFRELILTSDFRDVAMTDNKDEVSDFRMLNCFSFQSSETMYLQRSSLEKIGNDD